MNYANVQGEQSTNTMITSVTLQCRSKYKATKWSEIETKVQKIKKQKKMMHSLQCTSRKKNSAHCITQQAEAWAIIEKKMLLLTKIQQKYAASREGEEKRTRSLLFGVEKNRQGVRGSRDISRLGTEEKIKWHKTFQWQKFIPVRNSGGICLVYRLKHFPYKCNKNK